MEQDFARARSSLLSSLSEAQSVLRQRLSAAQRSADPSADLRRLSVGLDEALDALSPVPWRPYDVAACPRACTDEAVRRFFSTASEVASRMETLRRELEKTNLRADDLHEASRIIVSLLCTLLPDDAAQVSSQKMLADVFRTQQQNHAAAVAPAPSPRPSSAPTAGPSDICADDVLQGAVEVEGPLVVDGRQAWLSNCGSARPFEVAVRGSQGSQDQTLDLAGALVAYAPCTPREGAGAQGPARSSRIVVTPASGGSNIVLEAPNEREAAFWYVAMRRLSEVGRRSNAEERRRRESALAHRPQLDAEVAARVGSAFLVQHYEHLNGRMKAVQEELAETQASLRAVEAEGFALTERFAALEKRKKTLYHERCALNDSLRKLEMQMASKRGGGSAVAQKIVSAGSFLSAKSGIYKDAPPWACTADKRPPAPTPFKAEEAKGAVKQWIASKSYQKLPYIKVAQQGIAAPVVAVVAGNDSGDVVTEQRWGDALYAKAVSNYPVAEQFVRDLEAGNPLPQSCYHMGDPVCDHYAVKVVGNRVVMALCDGCNWGLMSLEAATRASHAFVESVARNQHKIFSTEDTGDILLLGLSAADECIVKGKEEPCMAGTTTMVGGILLEVSKDEASPGRWAFACLSVGDCKAFRYSRRLQTVEDITESNRTDLTNMCDPGGRLGPYVDDMADLRNLQLHVRWCDEGDLIFLVSDGVHDNFDVQQHGDSPRDWNIHADTWEEAAAQFPVKTAQVKEAFMVNKIKEVLNVGLGNDDGDLSPEYLVEALVSWTTQLTEPARKWIEANPRKKMPLDTVNYPGKLDHASCACNCVALADVSLGEVVVTGLRIAGGATGRRGGGSASESTELIESDRLRVVAYMPAASCCFSLARAIAVSLEQARRGGGSANESTELIESDLLRVSCPTSIPAVN
eukprot:m51a1_g3899 hypothetical protein (916) ;mRNA; r:98768-102696